MAWKKLYPLMFAVLAVLTDQLQAAEFTLDGPHDSLVGKLQYTKAVYKDTLLDIAREHDLGYNEIKRANPDVDVWLPGAGRKILLPTQYLLPHAPHKGIVLNIPEMRLYYYPPRKKGQPYKVITFPVGIGRQGWDTPYTKTRVIHKQKHPSWYPPKSIRAEHAAEGDPLPVRIGPGPDNPLGNYALRLALPSYMIHGTDLPAGVGMRVSHGCIRLYPENIKELFSIVKTGTPVNIVNQPYKLGLHRGKIYLEAIPYLKEDAQTFKDNLTSVVGMLIDVTKKNGYRINWALAQRVIHEMKGIPVQIGRVTKPPVPVADDSRTDRHAVQLRLETKLSGPGQ